MNKHLKRIITFIYAVGIVMVLVGLGILGPDNNYRKLATILFIFGTFLCLLFHFVSYREEMKKNYIHTKNVIYRFAVILIMAALGFLWFFFI